MASSKKYTIDGYMKTKVTTVNQGATFKDALEIMAKNKRNGLVVLDDNNKVVGMLSSLGLIRHVVPDYLEEDKHLAAFESEDIFEKRTKEVKNDPIESFMNKHFFTVRTHHSLMEAATLMSEHNIRHLPVVDENSKLVGYITRTDIKKAMADILNIKTD
jgi:CBS domain-containing protein